MNCLNCGAPPEPGRCSYCLTPSGPETIKKVLEETIKTSFLHGAAFTDYRTIFTPAEVYKDDNPYQA